MSPALHTYYITSLCECVLILKILMKYKVATIKNKDRKNDFYEAGLLSFLILELQDGQLGSELPYITLKNLPSVRTIVNNWTSGGLSVSRAKDAINANDLVPDLV